MYPSVRSSGEVVYCHLSYACLLVVIIYFVVMISSGSAVSAAEMHTQSYRVRAGVGHALATPRKTEKNNTPAAPGDHFGSRP
jgi:hypothetical protein